MKKLRGYLVAAIFAGISYVLAMYGRQYSSLIDMIYPYIIKTLEQALAEWSGQVSYLLWQLIAVAILVVLTTLLVVTIVRKKSVFQWFGWVLACFSFVFMIHTMVYGMNYYAGDLADDLRMEITGRNLSELVDATAYYQGQANALAARQQRDGAGSLQFEDFDTLAGRAASGFTYLTYERFFPVFAGSTAPVKKLGWADLYSSMGTTGVTFPLTGEAAVNPQIPASIMPFTMCREMARRMCIPTERDANFAAFLSCSFNANRQFQYSAYFMAYHYCLAALESISRSTSVDPMLVAEATTALNRMEAGEGDYLRKDREDYFYFLNNRRSTITGSIGDLLSNAYLSFTGEAEHTSAYGLADMLISWHIQEVVLPAMAVEESHFDPYDETQVDLTGIVNARG